jgi:hypothetical protein
MTRTATAATVPGTQAMIAITRDGADYVVTLYAGSDLISEVYAGPDHGDARTTANDFWVRIVDDRNNGRLLPMFQIPSATPAEIVAEAEAITRGDEKIQAPVTPVTDPGVYENAEGIFVVKPNQAKTRLYAKKLVEINGERLMESGDVVQIEFEYAPGAIFRLHAEDKMNFEKAKALTIRYGRCICCGRRLKAAQSVERGIGPVCRRYFS